MGCRGRDRAVAMRKLTDFLTESFISSARRELLPLPDDGTPRLRPPRETEQRGVGNERSLDRNRG